MLRLIDEPGDEATDAAVGLELGLAMLRRVAAEPGLGGLARVYRPSPAVAFSRRETRLDGFQAAGSAARRLGWIPLVRPTGGRAVAYDRDVVLVDLVEPAEQDHDAHRAAFARTAGALAELFRDLGVPASVGPVPGEYCPGEFSVGARDEVKLVGISQRATRGARLVSSMIVVGRAEANRFALEAVNRELGFDWSPDSWGSLAAEGVDASIDELAERCFTAVAGEAEPVPRVLLLPPDQPD